MQYCKTVTLRQRPRRNGTLSLFLDFYPGYRDIETMQLIRRQSLGIYIFQNPINDAQKEHNIKMLEKAEAIRCRVFDDIVNDRYDFFDSRKLKGDFLAYYKSFLAKKNQKWVFVYKHFEQFVGGKCTFEEVDVYLCRKFKEYLLSAKSLSTGMDLSRNSVAGYWSTFRGFLAIAFRDRKIKENVNDFLDRIDYIPTIKDSLTLDEVRKLNDTPCEIDILKRAVIFACLTGMRRSDILNLRWDQIKKYSNGGRYVLFVSQKTKAANSIPISEEAYSILPSKVNEKVFYGFKSQMTDHPMKEWIKSAGITKHITFHCLRHTYASLLIEMGTDIYTVQDLLAHKNVATTQIYAQHSDAKKREAAQKIKLNADEKPTKKKKNIKKN